MAMVDRQRFWLAGLAVSCLVVATGCPNLARPNWGNPGTVQQQQMRAVATDPYPERDTGPEMMGVRPREYDRPLPPAVRNQLQPEDYLGR
jgi:hypothetical protein